MKPSEQYPQECAQIIEVSKRLYHRNMLASADGNISLRVKDAILITPSGKAKAFIQPEDIAAITIENEILYGQPSSERLMHLKVYQRCAEAVSVVHAHPPTAVAWSIAYPDLKELPNSCISEMILATGHIPIVPYARPGTGQMGAVLELCLPDYKVMILSRHGGLSWGESLEEAFMGMERLEHSAEILYKAAQLNELTHLPAEEVQALFEMRKKIGNRTL